MAPSHANFTALVRPPANPEFQNAISTHPDHISIDPQKAREQHQAYVDALEQAGSEVISLPPLPQFPDSTFVEDNAVILNGTAFLFPMQAESRRGETASMHTALSQRLTVRKLETSATLDGGDVLQTPFEIFVGISERTQRVSAQLLGELTDLPVTPVQVKRGLHLKSSVSYLGEHLLVLDAEAVDTQLFREFDQIKLAREDRYAANCLKLGHQVIMPGGFPHVEDMFREQGLSPLPVPMSEFEKADGGVTCLSLIWSNV